MPRGVRAEAYFQRLDSSETPPLLHCQHVQTLNKHHLGSTFVKQIVLLRLGGDTFLSASSIRMQHRMSFVLCRNRRFYAFAWHQHGLDLQQISQTVGREEFISLLHAALRYIFHDIHHSAWNMEHILQAEKLVKIGS